MTTTGESVAALGLGSGIEYRAVLQLLLPSLPGVTRYWRASPKFVRRRGCGEVNSVNEGRLKAWIEYGGSTSAVESSWMPGDQGGRSAKQPPEILDQDTVRIDRRTLLVCVCVG